MASLNPTFPAVSRTRFAPIASGERIEALDALRGLALLMILIANMPAFNSPVYYLGQAGLQWWTSHTDHIAETLVQAVVTNESVALFSLLFGLGFAMQFLRAGSASNSFLPVYARRLLALIVIGAIHAFLIWMGDILILYGILGFVLLLFRNLKPKIVLSIAIALYLLSPVLWERSLLQQHSEREAVVAAAAAQSLEAQSVQMAARDQVQSSVHAYAHGSWSEITLQRARDYSYYLAHNQAITVFPMFLFGLYAGLRRFFQDVESRLTSFRRLLLRSACVAFPCVALLQVSYFAGAPAWTSLLRPVLYAVGHAALILFYISAVVLLQQSRRMPRLVKAFEAAGRMSLTNYLLQSVLCTLLFYSYGLGLYGKVGPALGVAVALAVFSLQAWLSVLWSHRFPLGPMEWLWRTVTYGRTQPAR